MHLTSYILHPATPRTWRALRKPEGLQPEALVIVSRSQGAAHTMDHEALRRLMESVMNLWIKPEVVRRQSLGSLPVPFGVRAAQVLLHPDGTHTVRLNAEVVAIATVELAKPSPGVTAGAPIYQNDIERILRLSPPEEDVKDSGHLTITQDANDWIIAFDTRLNLTKASSLLTAAEEFLGTASYALDGRQLRAAVDLLFSAAELAAKAWIGSLGADIESKKHNHVHANFNRYARRNVDSAQVDAFNQLSATRTRARYSADFSIEASQVESWNLQGCRTLLGFIENRNLVWANDTTGCPNAATRGVPATPNFSQADSTSQGFAPRVMSGLKVRGSSSLDKITAGVAAFRGLLNGVAMAPALELPAPDSSAFDVAILSPSGMFMTGFGFGAVDTTPTVQSGAASHSLGPEFEEYGGGFGGTSFMLACPTNKIPVGISSKAVLNPLTSTNTIGYFGIICADRTNWLATPSTSTGLQIVRGTFTDTNNVVFGSGTFNYPANEPAGTTPSFCPGRALIRGLRVRTGNEVDFIDKMTCSDSSTINVGVGGVGGTSVLDQDCWLAPGPRMLSAYEAYAPYFYIRSGTRLDGIAVGCYGPINISESFENTTTLSASLDWSNRSPPSGLRTWTTASSPAPGYPATGPNVAAAGSKWAFVEMTGGSVGQTALLELGPLDLRYVIQPYINVTFRAHMNGAGVGGLRLRVLTSSSPTTGTDLWTLTGSQGSSWINGSATLTSYRGQIVRLQLVATRGSTDVGDIAVDNIQVKSLW